MNEQYVKTGRYTKDGSTFHYVGCNMRIGRKLYCNVSEEKFLSLGFFPEVKHEIPYEEYNAELERVLQDPDATDFLYANKFEEVDGSTCWVKYVPSQQED